MTETSLRAVKVDQGRLMDALHYTCQFGTGKRWGRQVHLSSRCSPTSDMPPLFPGEISQGNRVGRLSLRG